MYVCLMQGKAFSNNFFENKIHSLLIHVDKSMTFYTTLPREK